MSKGSLRSVGIALALLLVATACGSRVDEAQRVSASASNAEASPGAGKTGGGDVAGTAAASEVPAGSGPTATVLPGTPGASGAPAPTSPEGGNGGATDVGVTADTVLLGNVSTLSGPVPGLFQGAVIGAQAVIAYQNSKGGLFGRKFKLEARDDQFDTGQNRAATIDLLTKAFAFVGSFSLYDDAAVQQIQQSGIPDVTYSLSDNRRAIANNFSIEPAKPGGSPTGSFNYFKKRFPDAVTHMGTLYGDVPASKSSHEAYKSAAESVGWHYVYERGYAATETDFTADVVRMRQSGVKGIFGFLDSKNLVRFLKAMQQQNFKPDFVLIQGPGYGPDVIPLGGAAVEGLYNAQPYSMFLGEDAGSIPEVKLFNDWLQKVKPGYKPDLYTAFAWGSGRLLFQAMEAAGAKATRAAVIAQLKKIDDFSSNGMLAPAGPASKRPPDCYLIMQIKNGSYERVDTPPPGYRCNDGGYHLR